MGLDNRDLGDIESDATQERIKFVFLSIAFFFVIGGYTIAKELKDSVFASIIGKDYIPLAKILSMFVLVPAIFLYSLVVDRVRRYQLLMIYSALFSIVGLLFAYLLGSSTVGLSNTHSTPYRLFGWLFYFFVEGYSPFVVSVFWAFANSISSPEGARRNYPFMVAASKVGGLVGAGFAWYLLAKVACDVSCSFGSPEDVWVHQVILGFSSAMLLLVPVVVYFLMRTVGGRFLHGYEAVYKAEKVKGKEKVEGKEVEEKTGMWEGLVLLLKYPYVLGIFGMIYFYEVIATVLSYLRIGVAQADSHNISAVSASLFKMVFFVHLAGFFMSLFGTSTLMKRLGERTCLMLVPLLSGVLLLYLMIETTPSALIAAFIALKTVNYAFAWPVRESLYIPTIKAIKFKSKSWIDAFGSKFAKAGGSTFNIFVSHLGPALSLPAHSFFFAGVVALWFAVALLLGRRFDRAVARNEVIGLDGVGSGE